MRYRIDLKKEREKRGLTQAQLADRIGVTEKSISKWESGRGQPSYDNMLKICKVYSLDINKIDCVEISRQRANMILNICLIFINVFIAVMVIFHIFILKDINPSSKNPDAALYEHRFGITRAKLWLMWFIVIPIVNLFMPIILRKNIAITSSISILTTLFCMFVFKDIYSMFANSIILVSILGILIVLFVSYKKIRGKQYD